MSITYPDGFNPVNHGPQVPDDPSFAPGYDSGSIKNPLIPLQPVDPTTGKKRAAWHSPYVTPDNKTPDCSGANGDYWDPGCTAAYGTGPPYDQCTQGNSLYTERMKQKVFPTAAQIGITTIDGIDYSNQQVIAVPTFAPQNAYVNLDKWKNITSKEMAYYHGPNRTIMETQQYNIYACKARNQQGWTGDCEFSGGVPFIGANGETYVDEDGEPVMLQIQCTKGAGEGDSDPYPSIPKEGITIFNSVNGGKYQLKYASVVDKNGNETGWYEIPVTPLINLQNPPNCTDCKPLQPIMDLYYPGTDVPIPYVPDVNPQTETTWQLFLDDLAKLGMSLKYIEYVGVGLIPVGIYSFLNDSLRVFLLYVGTTLIAPVIWKYAQYYYYKLINWEYDDLQDFWANHASEMVAIIGYSTTLIGGIVAYYYSRDSTLMFGLWYMGSFITTAIALYEYGLDNIIAALTRGTIHTTGDIIDGIINGIFG